MQLIDGKLVAETMKKEIAGVVQSMVREGKRPPHLAAILVGHDGGSETYVNHKVKDCAEVGIKSTLIRYEDDITEQVLLDRIEQLNRDPEIDGFIVQLPLPGQISENRIIESVSPGKDVDGFHPVNLGRMVIGLPAFISATPSGIIELISRYHIETSGRHCVVIGRSNIVGRPVSILLSRKATPGNCTVTVCHSRTPDIREILRQADIIIAAIGSPGFVTGEMVKDGAVVIDVGTTRVPSPGTKSGFKLQGDVRFDEVAPRCSFITPVPGGVGPMTRIALLKNTLLAAQKMVYP